MSATQVILLERVDKLGDMGDVVTVKPGYARNYLLPQKKALRASKQNVAYFESQKKTLAEENQKRKNEASKIAEKIAGAKVPLIRQASEAGQLYGSVSARDIAQALAEATGVAITKSMVTLNQNYKSLGLFPIDIAVHPEVKVSITVNIARSLEEAEIQAKTGQALIADYSERNDRKPSAAEKDSLKEILDEAGLEALEGKVSEEEAKKAEEVERQEKSKERSARKAKKAEAESTSEETEE